MKTEKQKLNRAIDLLGEIASQDFVTDALYDCKELRRWKRKVLNLMTACGYVYCLTSEDTVLDCAGPPDDKKCSSNSVLVQ